MLMKVKWWIDLLASYRVIHAFKTALACLIALIVFRAFNLDHGQWVIITVAVVMGAQVTVGAAEDKSIARSAATVIGAVAAGLFLLTGWGGNFIAEMLILFIVAFGFAYLAGSKRYSYVGVLGTVTFAIIALTGSIKLGVAEGMLRAVDILIGVLISLVISKICLPIYARRELLLSISVTLRDLVLLCEDSFSKHTVFTRLENSAFEIDKIAVISQSFAEQNKLAEESKAWLERKKLSFDLGLCKDSLVQLKRVFRQILETRYSLSLSRDDTVWLRGHTDTQALAQHVIALLHCWSEQLKCYPDPIEDGFVFDDNKLVRLRQVIQQQAANQSAQHHIHLYAFLHSMEHLWEELVRFNFILQQALVKN
ncbi:Inner membrane protein YeeA [Piscirickettsia salmonis]|nr:Inner membrane protein YeeA [Piscirickettsia salmonis]QGP58566.1 Inner membrane protein YeeA [Piscirickettsia salmonis]QGP65152.1 Inner membrane protein YeeA [Piscirickettsia salmonis]